MRKGGGQLSAADEVGPLPLGRSKRQRGKETDRQCKLRQRVAALLIGLHPRLQYASAYLRRFKAACIMEVRAHNEDVVQIPRGRPYRDGLGPEAPVREAAWR